MCVQAITTTAQMLVAKKLAPFIQKVIAWTAQQILHNLHYKVLDWQKTLVDVDPWNAAALQQLAARIMTGVTQHYTGEGYGMVISEHLQAIYDELVGADAGFAKIKKRSEKLAKKARRAAANPLVAPRPWDDAPDPGMWGPAHAAAAMEINIPRKPKEVHIARILDGITLIGVLY